MGSHERQEIDRKGERVQEGWEGGAREAKLREREEKGAGKGRGDGLGMTSGHGVVEQGIILVDFKCNTLLNVTAPCTHMRS